MDEEGEEEGLVARMEAAVLGGEDLTSCEGTIVMEGAQDIISYC